MDRARMPPRLRQMGSGFDSAHRVGQSTKWTSSSAFKSMSPMSNLTSMKRGRVKQESEVTAKSQKVIESKSKWKAMPKVGKVDSQKQR